MASGASTMIAQSRLDGLASGITTLAVTGTNGKSTTTSMIATILAEAGEPVARVTTLGMWVGQEPIAQDGSLASLVRTLQALHDAGGRWLAMEVTSRALAAGFAQRWPADVAVFTNLSHDHLDRHGTPEAYLAAKAQLFAHLRAPGVAVLNGRDPAAALIGEILPPTARALWFAGPGPAPDAALDAELALAATRARIEDRRTHVELAASELGDALGGRLVLGTLGAHNVDNGLAAALACLAVGVAPDVIARGLAGFAGIEGRFQIVADSPLCIVDFAHTPDALGRALDSTRALLADRGDGRLACVFGCGGERDPDKRPPMGAVADDLADAVWLTTDNPRSEDARDIARAVHSGAAGRATWHEVPDRAAAIAAAIAWARPNDAVLIAGRGHERTQELTDGPVPSHDPDLVRAALAAPRG